MNYELLQLLWSIFLFGRESVTINKAQALKR